jgi:hypothetical protein
VQLSSDLVAPSFSWTLGQVYADQPGLTDMTKLMLYHKCIGSFEAKPLKRIQGAIPEISDREILDQYYRLKGFSGSYQMDEFVKDGIGVENVYYEVRKARLEVGPTTPSSPACGRLAGHDMMTCVRPCSWRPKPGQTASCFTCGTTMLPKTTSSLLGKN